MPPSSGWRGPLRALVALFVFCGAMEAGAKKNVDSNAVLRAASVTNGMTELVATNRTDLPKLWFPVGEAMTYDIYWGILHVGSSRVTTDWIEKDGKPLLRIRHLTKTNKVVAQVYPVEDTMETVIEPVRFLPIYFRKKLSEGGYRADEITVFDHEAKVARQGSFRNGNYHEFPLESDTRDIVTQMYWLRRDSFAVGSTNTYRVMADEKIYDLVVRATREEKRSVGDYGKVNVVRLDPEAAFNGLFVRKGKITVWVSNDSRKLCTRIDAEVPVASIHVELDKVEGPGDDTWVKPKK